MNQVSGLEARSRFHNNLPLSGLMLTDESYFHTYFNPDAGCRNLRVDDVIIFTDKNGVIIDAIEG